MTPSFCRLHARMPWPVLACYLRVTSHFRLQQDQMTPLYSTGTDSKADKDHEDVKQKRDRMLMKTLYEI